MDELRVALEFEEGAAEAGPEGLAVGPDKEEDWFGGGGGGAVFGRVCCFFGCVCACVCICV